MKISKSLLLLIAVLVICPAHASRPPRDVAGYYWVYDDGTKPFASFSGNTDAISMICPVWMELSGTNGDITFHEDTKVEDYAREHGIRVLPLIQFFSSRTMHAVFTNIISRARLSRQIVEALDSCKYVQGINLDFEGMRAEDRYSYNNFLIEISTRLKAKGYLCTIDVPAKSRENLTSSWNGWCDYAEIGRYCDIVMIMTYDEHEGSSGPGPISSVQMCDRTLAYATSVMPKEKVYLGLPFYGYDWPQKGKGGVTSPRYEKTMQQVKDKSILVNWDREAKCPWYTYSDDNGNTRTCYYEDARSIAAKLEIGRRHDVGGVCIWSLGGEDPKIWDSIRQFRKR